MTNIGFSLSSNTTSRLRAYVRARKEAGVRSSNSAVVERAINEFLDRMTAGYDIVTGEVKEV